MNKEVKCMRCGHKWVPYVRRGRPKQCPRCRNREWWKPRQRPARNPKYLRTGG